MSWGYETGKAEEGDIIACKERVVTLVGACDFSDGNANAVLVKAGGSHSTTGKVHKGAPRIDPPDAMEPILP